MYEVKKEDLDMDEVEVRGGRGRRGGRGGRGGGREGRGNHNGYKKNIRQNHNHGVDISDLTRNFTPAEFLALIQDNLWDNIHAKRRTKQRSINNNDDGDITARVDYLGSTIETLEDTVSLITDDQTYNGGGKKDGGNNIEGGNNNIGGNNNGGKMHIMEMVAETIDVIAETLEEVREDVNNFLI